MGINQKNGNWQTIINVNHETNKNRMAQGHITWYPELYFGNNGNIKTSLVAEQFIAAHCIPRTSDGTLMVHTERGKRRQNKLKGNKK